VKNLLYINGEWIGEQLEKFPVYNPANGEVVSSFPRGGKNEAPHAVEAAHHAFEAWSELTAYDRAKLLKFFLSNDRS
jgi:succinate-semialdehyde dehydrogenase/glutarate-semialdehyde dehydrogenase